MRTNAPFLFPIGLVLAAGLACQPAAAQVFTFTCSTAPGTGCRSQIPDAAGSGVTVTPGLLSSTITVPPGTCGAGVLADIDLTYGYLHDWKGDLAFEIAPPNGAPLAAGTGTLGDSTDDFDTAQPVFLTSFPALTGQDPHGAWALRVQDRRNSGVGALEDWTLSIVCQLGVAAIPLVVVAAPVPTAGESPATPGSFVFTRSLVDGNPLLVEFTIGGTASGADYAPIPLTVVIPAGQASVTIHVLPVADGIPEASETVEVTLADAPAYDPGAAATATVTILDAVGEQPIPVAGPFGLALLALVVAAAGFGLLRSRVG